MKTAAEYYNKYQVKLGLATAFLLPLKLSLTLVPLIPLIILWIISSSSHLKERCEEYRITFVPLISWIALVAISALFGMDFPRSSKQLLSLLFFAATIPVFTDITKRIGPTPVLSQLVLGQSIAAVHSIFEYFFASELPKLFIGKVSESGQLTMSIFVALGLLFLQSGKSPEVNRRIRSLYMISILLIGLALILNLKRGPWFGVGMALLIFAFKFNRKLILPLIVAAVSAAILISPVRNKIADSYNDFFSQGGRAEMWQIAFDLASRYPIGIGYDNSRFMREYDQNIAAEHSHFHNNLLNVLAETGWLGLAVYLWWIVGILLNSLLRRTSHDNDMIVITSLGLAILAWQAAGIVEYNFGDSEVRLVAFMLMGILGGVLHSSIQEESVQNQ